MKNMKLFDFSYLNARMGLNTKVSLLLFFLSILSFSGMAQVQRGLPKPSDPIDLSNTSDLVIFIVLPALVIILIFFWRRAIKKREQKRKEND